ncbi:MAG: c-type cytochrome domain-containing protein [Planctomycetota bacterium]
MSRLAGLALTLALAGSAVAQSKVDFRREVLPILEGRCVKCHATPKIEDGKRVEEPDGDLVLDSRSGILKGGEGGRVIEPWASKKSRLYLRCTLPEDDPDVMPASGDLLTAAQLATLARWIDEGAEFGDWVGAGKKSAAPAANPVAAGESPTVARWRELGKGLESLDDATIARAKFPGRIEPLFVGSPLLRVSAIGRESEVDDKVLAALAPLAGHVAQLRLSGSAVTDASLATIARMTRLIDLDLSRTKVTAKPLDKLLALESLRTLNLHHCSLGAKSGAVLARFERLEKIYLWETGLDDAALAELAKLRPGLTVVGPPQLPAPADPAPEPTRRRRNE